VQWIHLFSTIKLSAGSEQAVGKRMGEWYICVGSSVASRMGAWTAGGAPGASTARARMSGDGPLCAEKQIQWTGCMERAS